MFNSFSFSQFDLSNNSVLKCNPSLDNGGRLQAEDVSRSPQLDSITA